jgi:hypothetical protein
VLIMAARYNRIVNTAVKVRFVFITISCLCVLACKGTSQDGLSPRDAWLQAPKSQGAHWNREPQLDRIVAGIKLEGMTRAKVLSLLGQPGYSQHDYPGPTRVDGYRLSAKNDKTFRVDYDREDKVTGDMIDSGPCNCPFCTTSAPVLPAAVLNKSGLMDARRYEYVPSDLTVAVFEKKLGGPGQRDSSLNTVGGQVWLGYSDTWRISGSPNQFLIADGHVPARTAPAGEISDKPVESWAVVSFAPECLAE